MNYIAHIRNKDGEEQLLKNHLLETKAIAEKLGAKLGLSHLAGLAALLHDSGKFNDDFQHYLRDVVADPNSAKRGSVDHSTAGGKLLYKKLHQNNSLSSEKIVSEIVGDAIISHHSSQGLQDMLNPDLESDYLKRVDEKELDSFEEICVRFYKEVISEADFDTYIKQAVDELKVYLQKNTEFKVIAYYNWFFLTKFIYSCLIDADRINTMLFEENKKMKPRIDRKELFSSYYDILVKHLKSLNHKQTEISKINKLREEMSNQCDEFANCESGIYTLSIPTGGGKTLASLRFALKHAKYRKKERIIYVVPFNTIIEQNAATVRDILHDDKNILEHHSNVIEEKNNDKNNDGLEDYSKEKSVRLTKDNWDSPIIFTTMVQFLNVIYAKGTRSIRRFHNLSNAVIIFDEVQSVPLKCISMFNEALNYLKFYMNSTMVLCTATQPALDYVDKDLKINKNGEMIYNVPQVIEVFKRTNIINKVTAEGWNIESLTSFVMEQINKKCSVLVILNTTTAVRKTFLQLKQNLTDDIKMYHLSTLMCAKHRKKFLDEIRCKLKTGEKVVCISTQLIEAGVDISFECVIRSLAGDASIAQAAGRCNRNGEKGIQEVYVIKLRNEIENLNNLPEIKRGQDMTLMLLNFMEKDVKAFGGSLLSQEAMARYFKEYFYNMRSELDYYVPSLDKNLTDFIKGDSPLKDSYQQTNGKSFPLCLDAGFKTVGRYFNVIDKLTSSVLVPYEQEGEIMIASLNGELSSEELTDFLKRAQQYAVNLYSYQIEKLSSADYLYPLYNNNIYALDSRAYSKEYGIDVEGACKMGMLDF